MTDDALLRVTNLSVSFPNAYGAVPVLDDIHLSLAAGETLGLVGESGSGKSLLGSTILGLIPKNAVTSGSIFLGTHDMLRLTGRDEKVVRGEVVSLVRQDALSALNPNRRIGGHFLDLWLASEHGPEEEWHREAVGMLTRVALRHPHDILRRYPDELSGGMRQRVLIGLAVFRRPKLLIADEPTTALDRVTADEVLDLLEELRRELEMAIILISHDLTTVKRICDRVAVLYAGQVCEMGETATVIHDSHHRYTEALISSARSLRRADDPLVTIRGTVPSPSEFPAGCRFHDRCEWSTDVCRTPPPRRDVGDHVSWCFHPPTFAGSLT